MFCQKLHNIINISGQFLTDLLANFTKRGLIFHDDQNEWQQPHVLTKTTQYHQYLGQFLTDLLATFTKGG